MVISGIATIILLLILGIREFDLIGLQTQTQYDRSFRLPSESMCSSVTYPRQPVRTFTGYGGSGSNPSLSPPSTGDSRPPASPKPDSTPAERAEWERHRMKKHLTGQFVFPPVQMPAHKAQTSSQVTVKPLHRKVKTMTKIMEAGEVPRSRWSDEDWSGLQFTLLTMSWLSCSSCTFVTFMYDNEER